MSGVRIELAYERSKRSNIVMAICTENGKVLPLARDTRVNRWEFVKVELITSST